MFSDESTSQITDERLHVVDLARQVEGFQSVNKLEDKAIVITHELQLDSNNIISGTGALITYVHYYICTCNICTYNICT